MAAKPNAPVLVVPETKWEVIADSKETLELYRLCWLLFYGPMAVSELVRECTRDAEELEKIADGTWGESELRTFEAYRRLSDPATVEGLLDGNPKLFRRTM